MAFMKRDVNMGLLLLIIAAALLFTGFSVYYQSSFRDISLDYKTKLDQLQQVSKDLTTQKKELNETYALRVKAEQDKKALDQGYKSVSDENDQIKSDNSNLQSELSSTKNDLGEKTVRLEATQNILAQTQASLAAANSKVSSLNKKVSCLKDEAAKADADEDIDSC